MDKGRDGTTREVHGRHLETREREHVRRANTGLDVWSERTGMTRSGRIGWAQDKAFPPYTSTQASQPAVLTAALIRVLHAHSCAHDPLRKMLLGRVGPGKGRCLRGAMASSHLC